MFDPPIENVGFWRVWTDSVGTPSNINLAAWAATLPDLPIMVLVCTLDCMLKLLSTESKLPVKPDKDYEVQLYGVGNIVNTFCGCSVGYMQLKFNVINFGVMGNSKYRLGGIFYSIFCGVCFFWTTDLFNYFPRFFMATLLFFAGSGFVAENLWGSRMYLNIWEWLQILFILGVFIFTESLLAAVIVGGIITGCAFIVRYARVPCIHGRPLKGGEVQSAERRPVLVQKSVDHISNTWLLVLRLKGFVFFATAQSLTAWVAEHIEEQHKMGLPKYRRLRYVVFDCAALDGIDASGSKAFAKLVLSSKAMGVRILWSNLTGHFLHTLKACGSIKGGHDHFESQDEAVKYVEGQAMQHLKRIQDQWTNIHPMFGLAHDVFQARVAFDSFKDSLTTDVGRFGCPWQYTGRMTLKAFSTMLWEPGTRHGELFLVHSGKVGVWASMPEDVTSWASPLAIYSSGWFLNREAIFHGTSQKWAIAIEDGEVLYWSEAQWARMSREQPFMAAAIMRTALIQEKSDAAPQEEAVPTGSGSNPTLACEQQEQALVDDDVDRWLSGISIAKALGEMGFFDKAVTGTDPFRPKLPKILRNDLSLAFHTYCGPQAFPLGCWAESERHVPGSTWRVTADAQESMSTDGHPGMTDEEAQPRLPPGRLSEALMYAGIFGPNFAQVNQGPLTEREFVYLGAEAALMPLFEQQVQTIQDIFAECKELEDGLLDQDDLATVLRKSIHPDISTEEVDGITNMWSNGVRKLDVDTFTGIISRLIKRHELDWCIYLGIQSLQKGDTASGKITADMLLQASHGILTSELAEEMIWSADFVTGMQSEGKAIDMQLVLAALAPCCAPTLPLPPYPRMDKVKQSRLDAEADMLEREGSDILLDLRGLELRGKSVTNLPGRLSGWGSCPASIEAHDIQMDMPNQWASEDENQAKQEEVEAPEAVLGRRARLHLLLDYPQSSQMAGNLSIMMGMLIMVSVLTMFLEPILSGTEQSELEKQVWMSFEGVFTGLFTIELTLRFAVADALGDKTHLDFVKGPMNICDFVAVLPFFMDLAIDVEQKEFRLFRVARLMRLSRLIRLGRLAKRSATFAPIAVILVVIWGIYMKTSL